MYIEGLFALEAFAISIREKGTDVFSVQSAWKAFAQLWWVCSLEWQMDCACISSVEEVHNLNCRGGAQLNSRKEVHNVSLIHSVRCAPCTCAEGSVQLHDR